HTRFSRDWSSDVCSSDLTCVAVARSFIVDVFRAGHEPPPAIFETRAIRHAHQILFVVTDFGDAVLQSRAQAFEVAVDDEVGDPSSEERRVGEEGGDARWM